MKIKILALATVLAIGTAAVIMYSSKSGTDAVEYQLPFNMRWGVSKEKIMKSLTSVNATIANTRVDKEKTVMEVEDIPQKMLLKTLFIFDKDELDGMELQYGNPQWTSTKYAQFFNHIREYNDNKYGNGERQVVKEEDGTTCVTYKWVQKDDSIVLATIHFIPNSIDGSKCKMSVHYE